MIPKEDIGKKFTQASLTKYLNNTFGEKKSGVPFTYQDTAQYIRMGHIPNYLGGNEIEVITDEVEDVIIYKLK